MWYFNKTMRYALQGLYVDMNGVEMVKKLLADNQRVVLLPLFKSFADFFGLNYINQRMGLGQGFTLGNFDDTPRIKLCDNWLSDCGYMFSRREQNQSLQSNYVNSSLLREIIEHNQLTTVFQNANRFRSGKYTQK